VDRELQCPKPALPVVLVAQLVKLIVNALARASKDIIAKPAARVTRRAFALPDATTAKSAAGTRGPPVLSVRRGPCHHILGLRCLSTVHRGTTNPSRNGLSAMRAPLANIPLWVQPHARSARSANGVNWQRRRLKTALQDDLDRHRARPTVIAQGLAPLVTGARLEAQVARPRLAPQEPSIPHQVAPILLHASRAHLACGVDIIAKPAARVTRRAFALPDATTAKSAAGTRGPPVFSVQRGPCHHILGLRCLSTVHRGTTNPSRNGLSAMRAPLASVPTEVLPHVSCVTLAWILETVPQCAQSALPDTISL
jgi:hypothetical protein